PVFVTLRLSRESGGSGRPALRTGSASRESAYDQAGRSMGDRRRPLRPGPAASTRARIRPVRSWGMAKKNSKKSPAEPSAIPPSRAFRAPGGTVDVTTISTDATPIGPQSKAEAEAAMPELGERMAG